jgi:hypothetical protein
MKKAGRDGPLFPWNAAYFVALVDDWSVLPDCELEDDEFRSVDCWLALVLLETLWSPLPTLTPGLTLAAALTSVLLMPTFAFTPTFGLTVVDEVPVESSALDEEPLVPDEVPPVEVPGVPVVEEVEPRVEPGLVEEEEPRLEP